MLDHEIKITVKITFTFTIMITITIISWIIFLTFQIVWVGKNSSNQYLSL